MRYHVVLGIWLISDILLFIGAYCIAYFTRVGWILSSDFPFDKFLWVTSMIAPVWLLVLATTRTFHVMRNQATSRNFAYISYASLVGVSLFTLSYYFQFEAFFSRLLLVQAFVFSTAIIYVWHLVFQRISRSLLRASTPTFPTLIVGVTRESKKLIETLNSKSNPLKPVAILDARGAHESEIDGVPVLGKLNKLEDVLDEKNISHLVQCSDLEQSLNLLSACRQKKITYMVLPSVFGIVERDERIETLEGQPVTVVKPQQPSWWWFFR